MNIIISFLLCFLYVKAFRFPTPVALKRVNKPLQTHNCMQTAVDEEQRTTLYSLPNTLAPLSDVISFIQWWGKKQSSLRDSVVVAQNTATGVQFQMDESLLSLLDVFAESHAEKVMVQVRNNKANRVKVVNGNGHLLSLLDVVIDNLIDSIAAEVGSQLVEDFRMDLDDNDNDEFFYDGDRTEPAVRQYINDVVATNEEASKAIRSHGKEKYTGDISYEPFKGLHETSRDKRNANMEHQDSSLKHSAEDYEKEHFIPPSDLPTQEDINKLWVETDRTPEDDEMMRKFLAGELPQQDLAFDVDAFCAQADQETQKAAQTAPAPGLDKTHDKRLSALSNVTEKAALPDTARSVSDISGPRTEMSNVLYRSATANPATVVSVIQMWCQQYTSRGIGISATNTAEGAVLTFPFDGAPMLHLNAQRVPHITLTVLSSLVHNHSNVLDGSFTDLIHKAKNAIEAGLAKELESTLLTSEAPSFDPALGTQRKIFAIPMDAKLQVDEALAAVAAASPCIQNVDFTPFNSPGCDEDEDNEDDKDNEDRTTTASASSHPASAPAKTPIYPREPLPRRTPAASSSLPPSPPLKRRDPALMQKAAQVGVRLEKYENAGIEEQAIKELNALLQSSRTKGFLSVIKSHAQDQAQSSTNTADAIAVGVESRQKTDEAKRRDASKGTNTEPFASPELTELFRAGQRMSSLSLEDILNRPTIGETADTLRGPTPTVPVSLADSSLSAGDSVDIFQSPAELVETLSGRPAPLVTPLHPTSLLGRKENAENYDPNRPPDRIQYDLDNLRLETLITTLNETAPELHDLVIDGHRDLLLSENILFLLKRAQSDTDSMKVRLFYKKIAERASALVMELGMLMKVESARHLQTIQDVCRITIDYQHDEVQYLDQLEAIKPYFDKEFLSYLTYAIGEEMAKMRKNGVDPTLAPSEWLQVLTIVRKGVEAEFLSRYDHLIESILLVLRWDRPGDDEIRSEIFKSFVAITPAMELPFLKELAVNMIENILQRHAVETGLVPKEPMFAAAASEHTMDPAELKELVVQMKNLQKDVDLHLSDAYITEKLAEWEEEARQAGTPVYVRHRNAVRQHDIETAHFLTQQAKNNAHMGMENESDGFGGLLGEGKA